MLEKKLKAYNKNNKMKKYKIDVTGKAEQDMFEIYAYIAKQDSILKAENFYDKLEEICASLEHFPERGHFLSDLKDLSNNTYREIHFKSYRIIYKITDNLVSIYGILDSRRELKHLLMQRLIKA